MKTAIGIFILCCTAAASVKPAVFSIPDIVDSYFGDVYILLGNGRGEFRTVPVFLPTGLVYGTFLAAADLNGDGKADLVVGGSTTPTGPWGIFVCIGNGDGTFAPSVFYQAGNDQVFAPVVGDFNGDGILDIVIPGSSGIWLFTGKGGGLFNPGVLTALSDLYGIALAADFNGDGKLDLALQLSDGFEVVFGNGDGTFTAPVAYTASGKFMTIGDINGRGHVDIAIGGGDKITIHMFLNDGHGVFSLGGTAKLSGFNFTFGDVNGDGIPDIVDSAGCVALGEGHLKFAPDTCYSVPTAENSYNVVLADLRKNGRLDAIFGEEPVVSVLLNEGNGQLQNGLWIPLAGAADCAAAADYNGDGKPDLAVAIPNGVSILFGTGDAKAPYTAGPTLTVTGGIGCPTTGDLNGDGIPDLIFGSNNAGGLVTYLGNGDGTFRLAGSVAFSSGYFVLGDFNHDGKLDVAGASNQLAYGNGDGTFQTAVTLVADGPGFNWVSAGDINNDGWPDLVLVSYSANELYVLLNDHQGGFMVSAIPGYTKKYAGPVVVWLSDLNGDGNLDAVVQMYYGYCLLVFIGDGTGGFHLLNDNAIKYVGSYTAPPQVADVNGDGIPDLLLPSSGTLGIAYGRGNGSFAPQQYVGTGNGPAQIILSNVHGQPASANLPDIVEPDGNGGVMVLINTTQNH